MSDTPSTLVIGEARDFSTGAFRPVSDRGYPGSGRAELIIERRVWTGRYWADAGSRDAMEAYRVFRNRNDREVPRCKVTGNPVGTDTVSLDAPCKCDACHASNLSKLSNPKGNGPAVTITELDTGKSFRSTGPWV